MLRSTKYYLVGLVTGLIIASGVSYSTNGYYQLQKMDCKVVVADEEKNMWTHLF